MNNPFAVGEIEDWGRRQRGQGKRHGQSRMVMGAMSDAPLGVKRYVNPVGKLPPDEQEEYHGLPMIGLPRLTYLQSRIAGESHDVAIGKAYALEMENQQ